MAIARPIYNGAFFSDVPERQYVANSNIEDAKKLGQVFTPFPIACFMAKWIVSKQNCKLILDPATGLGIFLRAILNQTDSNNEYQLIGYDIDSRVLEKAQALFQNYGNYNVRFINRDYMFNDWDTKYDGIICNPPYQRFQKYKNRNKILAEFHNRLGLTLSGLTNLHTLFLLKSISQLSEHGRAAYILPSEFLNTDYGVMIKKILIAYQSLKYVITFDSKENLFDNVITTSCILLFDNSTNIQTVEFISVKSFHDLANIESKLTLYPHIKTSGKVILCKDLDATIKWHTYYQEQDGSKYKNLVPLSTYGKIVRGIATGDNSFFTFNDQKKRDFAIEDRYLLPCLTKANQAISSFFTQEDWETLKIAGKNVYLLNATDVNNVAIHRYIQLGEHLGTHQRYLTSHRTPWYALENRPPAPILVTVFNRNGLRFIRNEANVRNLTCFHCFYLNMFAMHKIDILMAYLITDVACEIFNDNRREYGNGLEKFEPNDLNISKVIDLQAITQNTAQEISEIYTHYRLGVLKKCPDISLLKILNGIFSQLLLR
jgi:adenine-specific DNA-methyltransferase